MTKNESHLARYAVSLVLYPKQQVAWFVTEEDAYDFLGVMASGDRYRVREVE